MEQNLLEYFWKRGEPRMEFLKISYREFPFYYIFLPGFLESWLNF